MGIILMLILFFAVVLLGFKLLSQYAASSGHTLPTTKKVLINIAVIVCMLVIISALGLVFCEVVNYIEAIFFY